MKAESKYVLQLMEDIEENTGNSNKKLLYAVIICRKYHKMFVTGIDTNNVCNIDSWFFKKIQVEGD